MKYLLKQVIIAGCGLILFYSCKQRSSDKFSIKVNYKNAHQAAIITQIRPDIIPGNKVTKVWLYQIPFGGDTPPVVLDSAMIKENEGSFNFRVDGVPKDEEIYQVVFSNGHVVLLSNDNASVQTEIDFAKRENYYTMSGSKASQEILDFIIGYSEKSLRVNDSFAKLDTLKQMHASDSMIVAATEQKNNEIKQTNEYIKQFLQKVTHPSAAIFALGWASQSITREEFGVVLDNLTKKFPNYTHLSSLKKNYDQEQAQVVELEQRKWTGKPAPELALPGVNGDIVKLSSFKGKYVLVDFWASWCGPCRQENPNVVKAYNRFKDKNFTVLGVSLDRDKDKWVEAIKDDKLVWTHVSDLQFWNSKAVEVFKFEGIPFNVLIDPTGKIIAEGLRGEELEKKLSEVL